jgi:hypothetical protein
MANTILAAQVLQQVNELKKAPWGPYTPDSSDGLKEVFEHLWSRLNEVHSMADALSRHEPGSEVFNSTLAALQHVANVSKAYAHMQILLRGNQKAA